MKIETQAIHAGHHIDPASGAVAQPIYLSTTFERAPDGSYPLEYVYGRYGNPNRTALETALCELEGGVQAAAFGSGSVATMSLLQALQAGDHVVSSSDLYFGIRVIMTDIFGPWGLDVTFVDTSDPTAVAQAIQPNTRLVILESPTNPLIRVTDIQKIAAVTHAGDAYLAVDNTMATPVLQQPLALGADFVIHATTKYLAGHSDALGGIVVAREESELFERLRMIQKIGGAVPSPFESWLTLRGIQTLPYRVRAHADNALKVAQFLADHPQVESVLYPGLPSHPGHEIAQRQMQAFGGMLSVQVKGGQEEAMGVAAKVKLFTRATSFGGTHSLIEHRASIETTGTTPENLLRLSVGLENADDLIADLAQALSQ